MTEEKTKDNEEHIFSPSSSNELSQPVSPQLSEIELSQFQQDVRLPGFATPSYQGRPQQQLNDVSLEVAARPTTLGLLVTRGPLASHLYRPAEQELKWRRQQQQECWSELVAKTSTPDWRTLLHPKNLETVDRYFQDWKAIVLQRPYELSSGRDIVSSFMSRLTEAATYAEMQPWCWAPWNEIVVLIRAFLKHSMVKVEANPDLGFMGLQADPLETFNQTYLDMLIQQDADLGYQIINSPGFEKTRGELFNERINPFRALSECDKNLRNTQVYEMASVVALKRIPGPNTTLEQLFAEADSVRASGISSAYTDQYWIWSIIFGITNASSWLGNPLMAGSLAQRAWKKIEADLLLPGNHPRKISPIQHEPCHLASAGVSRPPLQYSTVRDILLGPCYGYYIDGTTRPSAELSLAVDLIPQRFQDDAKSHLEANKSNCAACHLSKEDANNSNVVAKKGKRNILSLKQENEPTIKRAKLQAIGTKENSSRSVPASFVQSHDIARFPGRATNNLRKFQERAENALEWEQALDRASPANPPRVSSQCLVGVFRNPAKNKALLSKLIEKPEFIPRFAPRTSIGEGDNPCEVAEHLIRLEKNLCFVCGEPSGREHGKTCPDRVAWRNFQTQIILERGQHYFNDIMNKARKDIVVSLLERCDKPTFAGCQERIVEEISPDCDQDFQLGPDHLEM